MGDALGLVLAPAALTEDRAPAPAASQNGEDNVVAAPAALDAPPVAETATEAQGAPEQHTHLGRGGQAAGQKKLTPEAGEVTEEGLEAETSTSSKRVTGAEEEGDVAAVVGGGGRHREGHE